MGKINWARVILGGLLAGVVINVAEGIQGMIFKEEWAAAMAAMGVDMKAMEENVAVMTTFLVFGFVIGLFAVWFYAAIRPRYGPGPKTAACAGIAVWFLGYLMCLIGPAMMGLFPLRLVLISSGVALVEYILATELGAWLYKEA